MKQTTGLGNTHKAIIAAKTTLELLSTQMELVVDHLMEIGDDNPANGAYADLASNIWEAIMQTETLLKTIK